MMQAEPERLVVGLDVHKARHYAHCVLQNRGDPVGKDFSFPNTAEGFELFFRQIAARTPGREAARVAVVVEPTGPYWKPLGYAVKAKGWPLYLVSPEQVFHQRLADDPAASKLDRLDPKTIAKLFRDGKACLARLPEGVFLELRRLHREYADLTRKLAREKIQLKSLLAEVNPEFTRVFANPLGAIARALLAAAPTPAAICALGVGRLTQLIREHGNGITGRRKAEHVLAVMQRSIAVPSPAAVALLNRSLARVTLYRQQVEAVATVLTAQAAPWVARLTVIEGVEARTAARLIAELGDPASLHSAKALVKLAGLTPREFQSGSSVRRKPKLAKKGNPYLRTIAYQMALGASRRHPRLGPYYRHLLARGKPKLVALCAVARKLLVVSYHLLRHEPYVLDKIGAGTPPAPPRSTQGETPTPPSGP